MSDLLQPSELERYQRHLLLAEIGPEGQRRLKRARVLVVGAGGLGCPAALYLAAAGVGRIGIADDDRVDRSNLHRQILFEDADVGRLKVEAAARRLGAQNPDIEVVPLPCRIEPQNALAVFAGYDLVLDGSDRLATRYVTNDACVILGKPWVSAAIHRFEGQAMVYVPGQGPCYRCLFPDATDGVVPNCAEAGVLGVLPGVLGSLQATEAIKLILGLGTPLTGRFLTYDSLAMQFQEFTTRRRPDCAVCGDRPSILVPQPRALPERSPLADPPGFARLRPAELAAQLRAQPRGGAWALIDVREPREYAAGHLPGSLNIPIGSLDARFAEVPANADPLFLCRIGVRSAAAGHIAARHGRTRMAHLEGGLLAWAAAIDNNLKVIA
ncbi:MAG: molybdopterin-synthase adenylyltransferase MoeB [Steroidobacteraceae bacterium]